MQRFPGPTNIPLVSEQGEGVGNNGMERAHHKLVHTIYIVHTMVRLGFTHAVSSSDGGRTNPPQRDLQDMQSVAQRSGT